MGQQQVGGAGAADSLDHHGLVMALGAGVRLESPQAGETPVRLHAVLPGEVGSGHILPVHGPGLVAVPHGCQKVRLDLRPAVQDAVHRIHAQVDAADHVLLPGQALLGQGAGPGLRLQGDAAVPVHAEDQHRVPHGAGLVHPAVLPVHAPGKHHLADVVGPHAVVQVPYVVGLLPGGDGLGAEEVGDHFLHKHRRVVRVGGNDLSGSVHALHCGRLRCGIEGRGEAYGFAVHQGQGTGGQAGGKMALHLQRYRISVLRAAEDPGVHVPVPQMLCALRSGEDLVQRLLGGEEGHVGVHPVDVPVHLRGLQALLPLGQLLLGQGAAPLLADAEGAGGGQGGQQGQGQGRRPPPPSSLAQDVAEALLHHLRAAVEVGGQDPAAQPLLPPHAGEQGLAVGPAGRPVRPGHHQAVARQLQIRLRLPAQQVDQGVEPVDRAGRQQQQLIPQIPPPVVGQLVAQDEGQLPVLIILARQQQPGAEEPRQHGGVHRAADAQLRGAPDAHLPANLAVQPAGLLAGAPAPATGPAEEHRRPQQAVESEGRPARQPRQGQKGVQLQRPPRRRLRGRAAGVRRGSRRRLRPLEGDPRLPAHRQLHPGHLNDHRRLRRRQPGGQPFPPHRGQQQQRRHDQPHPVPPPGAVPPVQQGLEQGQQGCRPADHHAPLERVQHLFHLYPSSSSKNWRSCARSSLPMALPSYSEATMPVKLLP